MAKSRKQLACVASEKKGVKPSDGVLMKCEAELQLLERLLRKYESYQKVTAKEEECSSIPSEYGVTTSKKDKINYKSNFEDTNIGNGDGYKIELFLKNKPQVEHSNLKYFDEEMGFLEKWLTGYIEDEPYRKFANSYEEKEHIKVPHNSGKEKEKVHQTMDTINKILQPYREHLMQYRFAEMKAKVQSLKTLEKECKHHKENVKEEDETDLSHIKEKVVIQMNREEWATGDGQNDDKRQLLRAGVKEEINVEDNDQHYNEIVVRCHREIELLEYFLKETKYESGITANEKNHSQVPAQLVS